MKNAGIAALVKTLKDWSAKWRRRTRTERLLLIEAFLLLGLARLAVLVLPFRWLAASLGEHMKETDRTLSPNALKTARLIGGAVRSAAGYTPWGSVCLPQAVTAKWMLGRRHIASTLYLGVAKDDASHPKLAAHAWVRSGPSILTGAQGHSRYTVVSTFS